jgi:hypothetical protein
MDLHWHSWEREAPAAFHIHYDSKDKSLQFIIHSIEGDKTVHIFSDGFKQYYMINGGKPELLTPDEINSHRNSFMDAMRSIRSENKLLLQGFYTGAIPPSVFPKYFQ